MPSAGSIVRSDPATFADLTDQEQEALAAMKRGGAQDSGYSTIHLTRPQTIGYALTDSPAGLAAWITEKLMSWTDPRSELSPDSVLDNIMPYELQRPSRRWAEQRFGNIVYWNEPDRGGHFAAWEQPALFVDEVTRCFALLR